MLNEFEYKHLPPDGKPELHRLQSIRLKDSNEVIGYIVLYHDFPNANTLWIAVLAIHTDYQKNRYGQEVINQLIKEAQNLGYNEIGISVGIKNWPALRFWIQAGFTQVIKFQGDKTCSDNTFADLWLKKSF